MKGRKPLPPNLKVLHAGRKRKAPVQAKVTTPTPPEWFDAESLAEWNRIIAENPGTICGADRAVTAAFCATWSRWCAAETELAATGPVVRSASGAPMLNPFFSVSQRCLKELRAYAAELGLSPTSRTRLKPTGKPAKSKLTEFLNNA